MSEIPLTAWAALARVPRTEKVQFTTDILVNSMLHFVWDGQERLPPSIRRYLHTYPRCQCSVLDAVDSAKTRFGEHVDIRA